MSSTRTAPLLSSARFFWLALLVLLLAGGLTDKARAEDHAAPAMPEPATPKSTAPARVEGTQADLAAQLREAMKGSDPAGKKFNVIIDRKSASSGLAPGSPPPINPVDSKAGFVLRPQRPAAPPRKHDIHWSYEGEGAPAHWAELQPDYATCAKGQRQSPIALNDAEMLKGPAEAIDFHYEYSAGTVLNNGHTIQVNLNGDNRLTVRGQTYKLVQFHFHHPAEERINGRTYPMEAHFVHRNDAGQLAVLAVLLEEGEANPLIDKVWTHMPLDVNDSVPLPAGLIHVGEILPADMRYYQYMGSLTTPPCTEGVLWLVVKAPMSISAEQLRLFSQIFPDNARPVQPLNGRPVRDAALIVPGG